MIVYLDNAASTMLDSEVLACMQPHLTENYGNPSSTHQLGRKARAVIELSRKKIADIMGCMSNEIVFTSGGTEADNALIIGGIRTYAIRHVISSRIEHHAVIHTLQQMEQAGEITMHWLQLNANGDIDYNELEHLAQLYPNAMVSLMYANNEIGNLLDMSRTARICKEYGTYFHSDTVQSVGHYTHDLEAMQVHGLAASAHKFHGPRGVGFMYINRRKKISPYILGGGQERNMRAGTEYTAGIVGLAKALEIACRDLETHQQYIKGIKTYMIERLLSTMPEIRFNGHCGEVDNSLYTVLNVGFPKVDDYETMLFNLDMEGVCVSGGSACSSGATTKSHVMQAISSENSQHNTIRFSFSKYTTRKEIDYVIDVLQKICVVSD